MVSIPHEPIEQDIMEKELVDVNRLRKELLEEIRRRIKVRT